MAIQESLLDNTYNACRVLPQGTSTLTGTVTVGTPTVATYSCATTTVQPVATASGAAATTNILALLPLGVTGSSNTKEIHIEQIVLTYAWPSQGASKGRVEFRVATCSGYTGGTVLPILAHSQSDAASTMQVLMNPTTIGATAWILFNKVDNYTNATEQTVQFTRKDFPTGKAIILRNAQKEGLYVYAYQVDASSFAASPGNPAITCTITWYEI